MTDTQDPKPSALLKGIINTNDDPFRCAACSREIQSESAIMNVCCGKDVCGQCEKGGAKDDEINQCPFCHATNIGRVGLFKKQAKRGHAWAQYMLANRYFVGDCVAESAFEAVRWYRKAAAQGHTGALFGLSRHLRRGEGCTRDVYEAMECAEKALTIEPELIESHGKELLNLGVALVGLRQYERAIAVFMPLAKDGMTLAKYGLGAAYFNAGQMHLALEWYAESFFSGNDYRVAYGARDCSWKLDRMAEAKFWMDAATKLEVNPDDRTPGMTPNIQARLRKLRKDCKWCGDPLDAKSRKLCKGCKTYCYCSIECQKLHWAASDDGHREECKRVMELKQMIKSAGFCKKN